MHMTAKVYAITNNKGGTGKTTTTVNLADLTARANLDKRVCVIDLDPQGNIADSFGLREAAQGMCVSHILLDPATLGDNILQATNGDLVRNNLYVVPASRNLENATTQLVALAATGFISGDGPDLKTIMMDAFAPIVDNFDYVFIDCPPKLDVLKTAVYNMADFVIVPSAARYLDFQGAQQHTGDLSALRSKMPDTIKAKLVLVIPTMIDGREVQNRRVYEAMLEFYGARVVTTPIPARVEVKEAPEVGMTLYEYVAATNKRSQALAAYATIAQRIAS
jgi:chromosome partitioning protein